MKVLIITLLTESPEPPSGRLEAPRAKGVTLKGVPYPITGYIIGV